jgi:hypothetical protein
MRNAGFIRHCCARWAWFIFNTGAVVSTSETRNLKAEDIIGAYPFSKQIIQMAEDFDLEGIQKLADALDTN